MASVDDDWEQFPVAECYELDALCDRFELAFVQDAETRIEPFVVDLPQPQQRLIVRELVQLEIELRRAVGESPTPDEFARRFPQWAEEIRALATQSIEDLDRARIAALDTIDQKSGADNDTKTSEKDSHAQWCDHWRASWEAVRHADLPTDGVLGHYRLKSVIGRGGMGLVVRAHDTKLTRDVALKILAIGSSQDDTANERFLREARAVAVIRHNHVVTIYAVEEINRIPFLVMELVEGTTLDEYLRENGKLAASEVASLACQMAQGLAAAHRQGLIHRDLKPANILLEKIDPHVNGLRPLSTWHVKITDFGLARVATEVRLTSSGLIAGTPQYMSPEQANGQEIDTRSDLFSLGSVMYAMCAGQAAFQADSALGIVRQVAEKPALSLREVSPQTPAWLIAIIEKLMAKSPDERFQSAAEVAELLSGHAHDLQFGRTASDLAVEAPATSPQTSLRSRTATVVALTIAGVAVAALGTAMLFRHDSQREISEDRTRPVAQAGINAASPVDVGPGWYGWPADAPAPAIAPFDAEQAKKHQGEWAAFLKLPAEYANSIGMKFVLIPPGEFMIGSTPEEIEAALTDAVEENMRQHYTRSEAPRHDVILTQPIYMSVHEVTQKEYETVMGTNPSFFSATGNGKNAVLNLDTTRHPVEFVTWHDAAEFCAELSEQEMLKPLEIQDRAGAVVRNEGTGYRLPTEAEWEFACRAGTTTKYWIGDEDKDLPRAGWFIANSDRRTHAVGELAANPLGLYDTHGNVWEMVEDAWDPAYYHQFAEKPAVNPNNPPRSDSVVVFRGGNWGDGASCCRASDRSADRQDGHHYHVGFRVVLAAVPSSVGRP